MKDYFYVIGCLAVIVIIIFNWRNRRIRIANQRLNSAQALEFTALWEAPPELRAEALPRKVVFSGYGRLVWYFNLVFLALLLGSVIVVFAWMKIHEVSDTTAYLLWGLLQIPLVFSVVVMVSWTYFRPIQIRKQILKFGTPAPGKILDVHQEAESSTRRVLYEFYDKAGRAQTGFTDLHLRAKVPAVGSLVTILYLPSDLKKNVLYRTSSKVPTFSR